MLQSNATKVMMYYKTPKTRGFTLIELLVVIAIIGLLSSVILASLGKARGKARDVRRIMDLRSVRTALELFYDSKIRYPTSSDGNCTYTTSFLPGGCLQALVTNGFIRSLPKDPKTGTQYYYDIWCRDGGTNDQHFRMWANGEFNHNSKSLNWWTDTTIGETNCADPS